MTTVTCPLSLTLLYDRLCLHLFVPYLISPSPFFRCLSPSHSVCNSLLVGYIWSHLHSSPRFSRLYISLTLSFNRYLPPLVSLFFSFSIWISSTLSCYVPALSVSPIYVFLLWSVSFSLFSLYFTSLSISTTLSFHAHLFLSFLRLSPCHRLSFRSFHH